MTDHTPDDVRDYAKQSYWDRRYAAEEQYDWFPSRYESILQQLVAQIMEKEASSSAPTGASSSHSHNASPTNPSSLRIVHLGCGNSNLAIDMATRFGFTNQLNIDYSPVVIANMSQRFPSLEWKAMDVRSMSDIPDNSVDVVIDKGTMDALQADKDNDAMDNDINAMLKEVSRILVKTPTVPAYSACGSKNRKSKFFQISWEIPYYRLHWTRRPHYAWSPQTIRYENVGEDDMYRIYTYEVLVSHHDG